MRVLHFLRPSRTSAAAAAPAETGDGLGLDAFAAEAPATASTADTALDRWRIGVVALAILVVLESIPAAFWILSKIQPVTPAAAAPVQMPPIAASTAAPCAAETPAATTGTNASNGAVPPRPAAAAAVAAAPGLVAGLVSIAAPVPMYVYERGKLIGTTEADSIMLPVGTHDLELVNDDLGYRVRRNVSVQAGRTSAVRIDAPKAPIHVNAMPWAEVWIDDQRVGETPIGNLLQPIGPHEIVFRHPEFGERRTTVTVTLKEPARVSMDMRKK
jgi:hypothetical protein